MVSFTAIVSALAVAIAATNAQVDPGQSRASINFYGSTNCGQNFIEQDTVFLPANTPTGPTFKSVGVCYDLAFASVGVAQLLRDPSTGNTCTLTSFSSVGCTGTATTYTSATPFCKPPVAGSSWRVTCV